MDLKFVWNQQNEVRDQRFTSVEAFGVVVTTCGTAPFVHLQLEQLRRMFGSRLPILISNDGTGDEYQEPELLRLCEAYDADYTGGPYLGHSQGDVRSILHGLEWASMVNADILIKFSRRFIPLVNWRHGLQCLAAMHPWAGTFSRPFTPGGRCFRTDCVAMRVRLWNTMHAVSGLSGLLVDDARKVNVEPLFSAIAGGVGAIAEWDLLGPDHVNPYPNAMQWRGLESYHYGDLARQLGLPYDDSDFEAGNFGTRPDRLADPEQYKGSCSGIILGKSYAMTEEEAIAAAKGIKEDAEKEVEELKEFAEKKALEAQEGLNQ